GSPRPRGRPRLQAEPALRHIERLSPSTVGQALASAGESTPPRPPGPPKPLVRRPASRSVSIFLSAALARLYRPTARKGDSHPRAGQDRPAAKGVGAHHGDLLGVAWSRAPLHPPSAPALPRWPVTYVGTWSTVQRRRRV